MRYLNSNRHLFRFFRTSIFISLVMSIVATTAGQDLEVEGSVRIGELTVDQLADSVVIFKK